MQMVPVNRWVLVMRFIAVALGRAAMYLTFNVLLNIVQCAVLCRRAEEICECQASLHRLGDLNCSPPERFRYI